MNAKGLLVGLLTLSVCATARAEIRLPVADDGWRLWPDREAGWKDDTLYLPDETADLSRIPTNPPTGGWGALSDDKGVSVALPATVEQYFWGAFGSRPVTEAEYAYAAAGRKNAIDPAKVDTQARNGNYEGVSWWWKGVDVPASFGGKAVVLHVRGARQRAEVYVNRQLVGYDMIEETAFDCDVSKAIRPGQRNEIAVRITNPGGRLDWIDFTTLRWGKYEFQSSHGFGGLDRGITLRAYEPVYFHDVWALNTASARSITAHAEVKNTTAAEVRANVRFDVRERGTDKVLASGSAPVAIAPGKSVEASAPITYDQAQLWTLSSPHLYELVAHLDTAGDRQPGESSSKPFGFRSFETRGVGTDAGLFLNGQRVRLYSAISWGYWGGNALWPTPELAAKEVADAKQLNLNMLNFHRNIGKEDVFARQDETGLLRYMEAGGGGLYFKKISKKKNPASPDTSGNGGEPKTFGQRYIEAKVERMVRQFRGHPSLVVYVLQNETEPDYSDPHLFYLLRRVHELDPSRAVAAKSGISFDNQA